ncbi:uncharacterized protein OGAPODRAFT_9201 [Ogataea polymorpha]|uniref:uncharacterized protein n=1 Tax=Ogataea polymorpha TaxID=460523 RepID=UPI0007F37931|nr:uncharacterized protein OGAPODRAFT_9201 [Ogataea polymorpha]OBA14946.1 hypothetical protein OGAPODRAFT_9201 [Ogataea polymorpha]
MSFDPLDFLSPVQYVDTEPVLMNVSEEKSHLPALHVMDLPQVGSRPPACVLKTILYLLKSDDICNFGQTPQTRSIETVKREHPASFAAAEPWLQTHCSLLCANFSDLGALPTNDIVSYLTGICGSSLSWMDAADREDVWALASTIISEKSGRTAAPGFTRKITVDGLPPICLREPALTSDNLGLKTWGSSLMLARRLVNFPRLAEPILELGAGTGLVGIACGLLGYKDVVLTDLPEIVPNLKENILLNQLDLPCEVLDWKNPHAFGSRKFATVIVSDPIYSADHPVLVRNVVERFLAPENAQLLVQLPLRPRYERERAHLWSRV